MRVGKVPDRVVVGETAREAAAVDQADDAPRVRAGLALRNHVIARDTLFKGTALSAPVSNLVTHAAMTAVVARRPSRRGEQALGGFGALLVAGYLGERLVRQRLRPSGWDTLESPLLVIAFGLAVAMAVLGLRASEAEATE